MRHRQQEHLAVDVLTSLAGIAIDRNLEKHGSKAAGLGGVGASVASRVITAKLTRDQEREADAFGLRNMTKAGFDPQGAVRAQQRLLQLAGSRGFSFFDTHPTGPERIANLQTQMRSDPIVLTALQQRHQRGDDPQVSVANSMSTHPGAGRACSATPDCEPGLICWRGQCERPDATDSNGDGIEASGFIGRAW